MNEKVLEDEARINELKEMFDELVSSNTDLHDANATMSHASEIMKKEIEDLKARDESKSKQLDMLYVVIEMMECQRFVEEEAARSALDMGKNIADEDVLESSSQQEQKQLEVENVEVHAAEIEVNVEESLAYSRDGKLKRIEIERRRLAAKKAKAAEIVNEKKDGEEEDEDEEDDDFKDIDDYHYDGDDNDDKNDDDDDDDQGGAGGALIVKPPGVDNVDDYLNDEQNEEHEDA
ncbi:hypothetical protein Hanom_Chr10g00927631 [Helianthus anomalus]